MPYLASTPSLMACKLAACSLPDTPESMDFLGSSLGVLGSGVVDSLLDTVGFGLLVVATSLHKASTNSGFLLDNTPNASLVVLSSEAFLSNTSIAFSTTFSDRACPTRC